MPYVYICQKCKRIHSKEEYLEKWLCRQCGTYIPQNARTLRADFEVERLKEERIEPDKMKELETHIRPPSELTAKDVLNRFPSGSLRPYQKEIMVKAVEAFQTGKKCVILAAPTGFGKSYVNAAFSSATMSFYATPQIILMDQILKDPLLRPRFVEIKGRQNYRCYYQANRRVNMGKCVTEDYPCEERNNCCPYWKKKVEALDAQSVLTSFAYLLGEGQTEDESKTYLGNRDLLILDEAHNIEEQALNQILVRVNPFTIPSRIYDQILPQLREIRTEVQMKEFLEELEARLYKILERSRKIAKSTGLSVEQAEDDERIERYLNNYRLYEDSKSEWVWQIENGQLTLQPVFAREFMKQLIWKRADHYIISSATILDPREYASLTGLSGLLREDEICFLQAPSTFPAENRPVVDKVVGPLSMQEWENSKESALQAVEEILRREEGNVAIHCHSYRHQKWLAENISEDLKPRLITHSSRDRGRRLNEWMHSNGKVFVSVAFSEGQDWKYDLCDAQILLKVPFPYLGDRRVERRLDLGLNQWYKNYAMSEVIQAYGRAIRAEDDRARFYIVDGSFNGLLRDCWRFIPDWFKDVLPQTFLN